MNKTPKQQQRDMRMVYTYIYIINRQLNAKTDFTKLFQNIIRVVYGTQNAEHPYPE